MKNFIKVVMILGVVALIFSCSDDDQHNPKSQDLHDHEETFYHLCGHDYYRLMTEGEIDKRHDTWDATPPYTDPCEADNLWVCVDSCFMGTPWECAITNAINAYNSLPSPYSSNPYYNIPNGININMNMVWDCS